MDMPRPSASVLGRRDRILARLAEVLPADALVSDPAETRAYECDALTAYRCPPLAAVLPRSTAEVKDLKEIEDRAGGTGYLIVQVTGADRDGRRAFAKDAAAARGSSGASADSAQAP